MKVLLVILIILALILLLRVGVIAEYSEAGAEVALKVGPVLFRIIPGKEKRVRKNPNGAAASICSWNLFLKRSICSELSEGNS